VYALLDRAARTTIPVLVLGETGSGKESIAQAVHTRSARAARPFKAINCAALPATLLSSTLFGHERGAFTGADRQTLGLLEQTHTGTLFLDEVGELSLEAQAALLRVLETGTLSRVGGQLDIAIDVRIVAATHRDLEQLVTQGTFRQDLLYRLDAFALRVPPLRERVEDISALAIHFLAHARGRWGTSARGFSDAALMALEHHSWPGNVRQLRNVVERAAAVTRSEKIELDDLPDELLATRSERRADAVANQRNDGSFPIRVRRFEESLLRDALGRAHGNQTEAARLLGLPRRTLTNKVHAYGLLDVCAAAASAL
jgi:two-component system response regulator AtoC